jgi:hypothetical protein
LHTLSISLSLSLLGVHAAFGARTPRPRAGSYAGAWPRAWGILFSQQQQQIPISPFAADQKNYMEIHKRDI